MYNLLFNKTFFNEKQSFSLKNFGDLINELITTMALLIYLLIKL